MLATLLFVIGKPSAMGVLITSANETLYYPYFESTFGALHEPAAGIFGVLHAASPIDACTPLSNQSIHFDHKLSQIVIAMIGRCTIDAKMQVAQHAGFAAIIIFDSKDDHDFSMSGSSTGVYIPAREKQVMLC
ncbi:hypothetical protein O6H91_10G056700 [Diphasiastrum complanatum]|uniref:Uncharacterized protein n=1 Tax=Diphasiastrum complanatum TaxID=34168 RepID=A0ACC2CH55_DIPCM|nr:hypothetical protein O6H91_10G056700 [Diphasiastrum complanatum]